VRILLPMVETVGQLEQSEAMIEQLAGSLAIDRIPPIGPMIETPAAARNAAGLAARSAFLSIGTNDLTAATLGVARFEENTARAHHPDVLRAIARSVAAAHEAGVPIEVCGEAASDPVMLPLLVGAGVDQVSVGAARLGEVRSRIRALDTAEAAGLFHSALTMDRAEEVEWAARSIVERLGATRSRRLVPRFAPRARTDSRLLASTWRSPAATNTGPALRIRGPGGSLAS
jgi:phosphoenolpyruvate-protein kinase (PTS system EI component)